MPGYKQWSDGDNLTPADIDGFLMGQTVMRFVNAAARAGALPTPVDGMMSYLADTGLTYQYDSLSAAWVADKQCVKKTANQSVTSSATLVADTDLKVTLTPGQYRVEVFLHYTGATAGDIAIAWAFSGTNSSVVRTALGPGVAATAGDAATSMRSSGNALATRLNYGAEAASSGIREDILITVTGAGVLQMSWAQDVASTTATVVSAASRLYVTRFR
jgi:hypothetical protein